jgi:hypothetical protein
MHTIGTDVRVHDYASTRENPRTFRARVTDSRYGSDAFGPAFVGLVLDGRHAGATLAIPYRDVRGVESDV